MSIGELCNRAVTVLPRDASIREAVRLMREKHVGDVIVVDDEHGQRRPAGILTDRDVVIELVAKDVDLDAMTVADAMSNAVVTVRESEELDDTIDRMRVHGVRRMPVVDDKGALVGIVTLDNLIDVLTNHLSSLVLLTKRERTREARTRTP
jgi:CBS domain-containing protein